MSVLMSEDKKELIVKCSCGCGQAFNIIIDADKDENRDTSHDLYAFICFMKNNCETEYDKNPWRAFKIKMKKIWFILRGKDYCYSDTVMSKKDFEEFKKYINQF